MTSIHDVFWRMCLRTEGSRNLLSVCGQNGDLLGTQIAVQVSSSLTGEWSEWEAFGAGERRYMQSVATFETVRPFHLEGSVEGTIPDGWLQWRVNQHYTKGEHFTLTRCGKTEYRGFTEGADVCLWCGHNNTAEDGTSYRQGWDCECCGGN